MTDLPEGLSPGPAPPDKTLRMVSQRESGGKNLPPQANYAYPYSHASGVYQDQPSTWQQLQRESGIGTNYREAYEAPPDVQEFVNAYGERKYGPNSSFMWAASAPAGGYPQPDRNRATLPKGLMAGAGLPKGLMKGAGPKKEKLQPGPEDPSIQARQKATPSLLDRAKQIPTDMIQSWKHTAETAPLGVSSAEDAARPTDERPLAAANEPSIKAREPQKLQTFGEAAKKTATDVVNWWKGLSPDLLSNAMSDLQEKGFEKAQDTVASALRKIGVGNPEAQAHNLISSIDILSQVAPVAGMEPRVSVPKTEAPGLSPAQGLIRSVGEGAVERELEQPARPVTPTPKENVEASTPPSQKGTWMVENGVGYFVPDKEGQPARPVTPTPKTTHLLDANKELVNVLQSKIADIKTKLKEISPYEEALKKQRGEESREDFLRRQLTKRQQELAYAQNKISLANSIELPGARVTAPKVNVVPGQPPLSVGAAASNKAILQGYQSVPPTPTQAFIQSTDDSFFRLRGAGTADKSFFDRFVRSLPPELKDAKLQERLFKYMEGDTTAIHSAEEKALHDKYIAPLRREAQDLYEEIKKLAPGTLSKDFDPTYVHRMVKGKTKEIDPWMGEAGHESASPVGGFRYKAASQNERVYYAMENEKGQRKVIAVTDHGSVIIDKGRASPLPRYQGEATKPGDKFTINGEKWEVKQARTSEIEANTSTRYYKNAMASAIKNVVQLRAAARALNEIERLKSTPEWNAYTVKLEGGKPAPKGWETVNFPPFRGYAFEPKFAHVIQDFWDYKKPALGEAMAAINRFSIGSMFWSPVPHALNAGAHWVTERGWDWVVPHRYATGAIDAAKAVREVITQGPKYQQLLREGSGLVYGSVANEEFYRIILKKLGESVQREPAKWDPIARAMGVGPSDLVRMLYGASSRALWSVSDMMMVQRVLELERKGKSTRSAIAEAEKHIPNYRIPPEVLGSRMFAQILKDPSLTTFSRYHYGQWKSYAHMARDLASIYSDPVASFKAMGNIFATAVLVGGIGHFINQQLSKLTDNKKDRLELGPKGSAAIPANIWDLWHGKPIEQVIQNSITLAPAPKMLYEGLTNTDWFTKRNIVEPFDLEKHRFGRVGAQIGEEAAQQMLLPYGTVAQGMEGKTGVAKSLVKQGLGLRKPFEPYRGRTGGGTLAQQATRRHVKPRGPIEQLEKSAEKYLNEQFGR